MHITFNHEKALCEKNENIHGTRKWKKIDLVKAKQHSNKKDEKVIQTEQMRKFIAILLKGPLTFVR
jgi:predicted phosphohydrolase